MAPRRAERPHDVGTQSTAGDGCPFCEGSEAETPPEVFAVRSEGSAADGPGWQVRAFPNKFPAIAVEEGVHEVVVTTPRHVENFADATADEAVRAVETWAARLTAVAEDARGLWPFLFLNQGAPAGASLQHSHAQVVGLPFAPPRLVRRENTFSTAHTCPICSDFAGADRRTVADYGELVAWCPEVPPLSGTIRIAPLRHVAGWADELDAGAVGAAIQDVMARLRRATGAEAVNLWLHQRRPDAGGRFHWHIELVARVGTLAGLELGAGALTVAQHPEALAERLRSAA
jgi:UDPglucose--hexose-1-phosphate uridylyltransferase